MTKKSEFEYLADLILELDADIQEANRNRKKRTRITKKSNGEVRKIPKVLKALKDEEVIFCRKYHKWYSIMKLAMKFEVGPRTVLRALIGITHKHLNSKVPPAVL
jgi:predicted transcriptional regulator